MQIVLLPEPSATNQALKFDFIFVVIPEMGFQKSLAWEFLSAEEADMPEQLVCQVINNLLFGSFIQFSQVDTDQESWTESALLNDASFLKLMS